MADAVVNGKQLTGKELEEHQRQQMEQQQRIKQRAEALVRRIGETCDELERLAEENPELVGRVTYGAEEHKEAYLRLKARLELADAAPRCRWVRTDGTTCGSPQMKKHIYCFAHKQMAEAQALALMLPALEDANAIQVGIMRIQKALIDDTISVKKAGLLLYSMQLALQNVGQVTFGQAKAEEQVRETVSVEEALSNQQSAISQKQNQHQKQTPTTETRKHGEKDLPLMDADRRRSEEEENQGLPRINADDRGSEENQGLPLIDTDDTDLGRAHEEFVPMAEGYGYTRVRLKIEPERILAEAALASDDRPESRANLHPATRKIGATGTRWDDMGYAARGVRTEDRDPKQRLYE